MGLLHRLCVAFLSVAAVAVPAAEAVAASPNVILVMCDDLGWGDVGFNGNKIIKTPHLDDMAASGLKLNRFYAAAPVCSPTRGSCLTGRHPYRYGVTYANSGHLLSEELNLAELLKAQGYATGHFGKWHLGTLTKTVRDANRGGPRGAKHYAPPWEHGFDHCFSTESKVPTWDPMIRPKNVAPGASWWHSVAEASEAVPYGTSYWTNGDQETDDLRGDDSKLIMDRVLPFIEKSVRAEQSFFAVVWFHTPHLPVVAGPEYTKLYEEHGDYEQHYYGCITAMDEQVGRLRSALRQLGVAENTLVFFGSDNGPEGHAGKAPGSAGPFRGRKRSLYEGGIRVPAIIEWPAKIESGRTSDTAACTSDYFPTVLDVLDRRPIELVEPLDGVSLLPLIEGQMTKRPQPIAFESAGQLALIDNRYKLIYEPATSRAAIPDEIEQLRFELYDLSSDPGETRDLAAEHPEVVRRMIATLAEWRRSCAASISGDDYSNVN